MSDSALVNLKDKRKWNSMQEKKGNNKYQTGINKLEKLENIEQKR